MTKISRIPALIAAAMFAAILFCAPAQAQFRTVTTCPVAAPAGTAIYPIGGNGLAGLLDINGVLCTNSGAAGGVLAPTGASQIAATSGNVANATATATLAGAAGKTTYISGFQVYGTGATAAAVVSCTVTGIVGPVTFTYPYAAVAGVAVANTPLNVTFDPPLPASAANTAIVVSCPALGAGNTNNAVNANGFRL